VCYSDSYGIEIKDHLFKNKDEAIAYIISQLDEPVEEEELTKLHKANKFHRHSYHYAIKKLEIEL